MPLLSTPGLPTPTIIQLKKGGKRLDIVVFGEYSSLCGELTKA